MSGKYRFLVAAAVVGMLLVFIPAYGAVIVNSDFTMHTDHVDPFAYLSNSSSALPASAVVINHHGTEANVSLSGTWQLSDTSQLKQINGFLAQNLSRTTQASTYIKVSKLTGDTNLSQMSIYLNQSGSPGELEAEYTGGNLLQFGAPVSFGPNAPLNLSISFSPHTTSSKLIQYYHVYMSLILVTFAGSGGNAAYINETVNISITEQIF